MAIKFFSLTTALRRRAVRVPACVAAVAADDTMLALPDTGALPLFIAEHLQQEYSVLLYGAPGRVPHARSLRVVWLELLNNQSAAAMTSVGLCVLFSAGCLRSEAKSTRHMECMPSCDHSSASPQSTIFYTPMALLSSPSNSAWVHSDEQATAASGDWVEVTHCPSRSLTRSHRGKRGAWFYIAPGSGVSLYVGRTAVLDERVVHAAPRGASSPASREALRIKEALRVSEAMGHLGSGNADDAWLSERFGVNATRLESVQRIHTYGAHCTERQKPVEILLLDPTLSEAVTVSDPRLRDRIRCGRHPWLRPCGAAEAAKQISFLGRCGEGAPLTATVASSLCAAVGGLYRRHRVASRG